MFEPKPIARESIERAMAKAERYRLLNEPGEAQSICSDVLAADPGNQPALVCLILALTDEFDRPGASPAESRALVGELRGAYEKAYYGGVIEERWGKALHRADYPASAVYSIIRKAMELFDQADAIAEQGNDDAVLRWNACVRMIERSGLAASADEHQDHTESFDDDVPVR